MYAHTHMHMRVHINKNKKNENKTSTYLNQKLSYFDIEYGSVKTDWMSMIKIKVGKLFWYLSSRRGIEGQRTRRRRRCCLCMRTCNCWCWFRRGRCWCRSHWCLRVFSCKRRCWCRWRGCCCCCCVPMRMNMRIWGRCEGCGVDRCSNRKNTRSIRTWQQRKRLFGRSCTRGKYK